MSSRTRSRKQASIGSNHSLRRPSPISASEPRTGNFVLLLVMAWSPPAHNAGIVWVSAPGDYATFNSNHTPDGTGGVFRGHCFGPRYGRPGFLFPHVICLLLTLKAIAPRSHH